MQDIVSTIEYLQEVGYDKAFDKLKNDWKKKKAKEPSKLDYIVDEWVETLEMNLQKNNSDNEMDSFMDQHFLGKYLQINKLVLEKNITFENILAVDEDAIKYVLTHDHDLSDCEYWKHISDLYMHINRQYELLPLLKAVFTSTKRKDKHCLMTEEEIEYLESLPDEIEIHRGMTVRESKNKEYGISWSLDKKVAEFFAYKHPDNQFQDEEKTVMSLTIPKNEVIAYLNRGQEEEIIWVSK